MEELNLWTKIGIAAVLLCLAGLITACSLMKCKRCRRWHDSAEEEAECSGECCEHCRDRDWEQK